MVKNILVASDFSAHADRALERAIYLAHQFGAQRHLIHVMNLLKLPQWWERNEETLRQEANDLAQAHLKGYPLAEKVDVKIHIANGDAFEEIIALSQKTKADLIIMGLHNKTKFPDLFVGTTIERVMRKGTKPVLMVKDKPTSNYKKVAVAVDFSTSSQKALRMATTIAPKSAFSLINIYDIPFAGFISDEHTRSFIESESVRQLDEIIEKHNETFKEKGIKAEKRLKQGAAISGILAVVDDVKPHLLAIGTHARSGIGNAMIGSSAKEILAAPPCDVLVVGDMA
ncbi:MAG: universal stress protein E [Alphaproteobacteria bacterium]|jgi:universal stress protein E